MLLLLVVSMGYSIYTSWRTNHDAAIACQERRHNVDASRGLQQAVKSLATQVEEPFLIGAAHARDLTAKLKTTGPAEAQLNLNTAEDYRALAATTRELAASIKPLVSPSC